MTIPEAVEQVEVEVVEVVEGHIREVEGLFVKVSLVHQRVWRKLL